MNQIYMGEQGDISRLKQIQYVPLSRISFVFLHCSHLHIPRLKFSELLCILDMQKCVVWDKHQCAVVWFFRFWMFFSR